MTELEQELFDIYTKNFKKTERLFKSDEYNFILLKGSNGYAVFNRNHVDKMHQTKENEEKSIVLEQIRKFCEDNEVLNEYFLKGNKRYKHR